MKYVDRKIIAKSVEPMFSLERDGWKPNTVRVVPINELIPLAQAEQIEIHCVRDSLSDQLMFGAQSFTREISGIIDLTDILLSVGVGPYRGVRNNDGTERIVMILWRHEA